MALDTHSILDPIRAHAAALGVFDTVGGHEPKRAPGTGLTFALWVDRINPVPWQCEQGCVVDSNIPGRRR